MPFLAPPMPQKSEAERADFERWAAIWIDYATKAQRTEPGVRVARRLDHLGDAKKQFVYVHEGSTYHWNLRCVALTHLVFDLGDLVDNKPQPWPAIAMWVNATHEALTRLHIPFLSGPTSGKGWHVEVFLPPEGPQSRCHDAYGDDWRWEIARRITGEVHRILWGDNLQMLEMPFDKLFIAPREGSQLLTDYGEKKMLGMPFPKLLWHEGFGPAELVPLTREAAYARASEMARARGSPRPSTIPIAADAERFDTRWMRGLNGGLCPKTPDCFAGDWGACADCPGWC
jgi:hypothetical protein